jgi:membrane-associated phospholipid phosphatase
VSIKHNSLRGWIVSILFFLSILQPLKADLIEKSGDLLLVALPLSAYLYSYYQDDREGQIELGKSLIVTTLSTYFLKYVTHEQRPNKENDRSFPSGHSAITMSSAVYLHKRYGLDQALPAYIGAAFTGYSRVRSNNHYTHDVLAGALLGGVVSYYFTHDFAKVKIKPIFDLDRVGLGFKKEF